MGLIVYSKNNCAECVKVKNQLKNWNIEFQEVNIDIEMEARNWIVDQGHRSAPVLYTHNLQHIPNRDLTKEKLQQIIGGF